MEDLPKDINITSRQKPMAINLKYFNEETRNKIYDDLKRFNWETIDNAFDEAKELYEEAANRTNSDLEQFPRSRTFRRVDYTDAELRHHRNTAYESIRKNEFCVVTLAGGQASRLGASVPKGIYPLDLGFENEYQNSLFYLQAAQIYRLQQLAGGTITWLIMTSKATDKDTKKWFSEMIQVAGLSMQQVIFFTQDEIPCLDKNGRFLTGHNQVLTSPNGNGGFYDAIGPLLPKLRNMGIKYFHVYCVDNILARVGDPIFLGTCINQKADCAAKTVEKYDPHEKIGVICIDHKPVNSEHYEFPHQNDLFNKSRVRVIEYSEISVDQAEQLDPYSDDQKLYFRDGNIANHFFTVEFLEHVHNNPLPYHIAAKKIKVVDPKAGEITIDGIKLERFIFDAFVYSKNFLIYEVDRDDEFAPLKNNDQARVDCPSSCVAAIKRLHKKWIDAKDWKIEDYIYKCSDEITQKGVLDPRFCYEAEGVLSFKQVQCQNSLKNVAIADVSNVDVD